jgi:hypothetical protein
MVVKEGMILAGLGIVIGIAWALALSHLLAARLCGQAKGSSGLLPLHLFWKNVQTPRLFLCRNCLSFEIPALSLPILFGIAVVALFGFDDAAGNVNLDRHLAIFSVFLLIGGDVPKTILAAQLRCNFGKGIAKILHAVGHIDRSTGHVSQAV